MILSPLELMRHSAHVQYTSQVITESSVSPSRPFWPSKRSRFHRPRHGIVPIARSIPQSEFLLQKGLRQLSRVRRFYLSGRERETTFLAQQISHLSKDDASTRRVDHARLDWRSAWAGIDERYAGIHVSINQAVTIRERPADQCHVRSVRRPAKRISSRLWKHSSFRCA